MAITPHTVASAKSVAANKSLTLLASGGATTVPTDATRVEFSVSIVKEQTGGTLTAYPAGSPALSVGSVAFAPATTTTGTLTESVGLSNKVTFVNNSSGSIVLTVQIVGYSTQVLASDIAPTGGAAGQVLTNTGGGVAWQAPGRGYEQQALNVALSSGGYVTVAHLQLPAGSYQVSFAGTLSNFSASVGQVRCFLISPSGGNVQEVAAWVGGQLDEVYFGAEGLMTSGAGQATMQCTETGAPNGQVTVEAPVLLATVLGGVSISS